MTTATEALAEWEERTKLPTENMSSPDTVRLVTAMRYTPAIALPPAAYDWAREGRWVTGAEVAEAYAMLADRYSDVLRDREKIAEELRALKADVATMRRVLGTGE